MVLRQSAVAAMCLNLGMDGWVGDEFGDGQRAMQGLRLRPGGWMRATVGGIEGNWGLRGAGAVVAGTGVVIRLFPLFLSLSLHGLFVSLRAANDCFTARRDVLRKVPRLS